jgi:hypothetical protein
MYRDLIMHDKELRKFVLKVIFFLVPAVVVSLPLDFVLSGLLMQSHVPPGEFEVWRDIYSGNIDSRIAVYGSSRAWNHIDPSIISSRAHKKTYNLGIDGHNFHLQYLRHLEYLEHNSSPELILLSLDIFTLQKRDDLFQADQFLPFMLWNKKIQKFIGSYRGFSWYDHILPLIRYSGKGSAFMKASGPFYRKRGFKSLNTNWDKISETRARQMVSEIEKYRIVFDSKSLVLFENFIKECRDNKINLVFIYTPEYIKGRDFVSNRDEMMDIYKKLALKYNLIFLDYSQSPVCRDRSLFYNVSHLNKKGAETFSRQLARDLESRNLL